MLLMMRKMFLWPVSSQPLCQRNFSKTTAVRRLSYRTMPTSLIVVVGGESVTRVVNPF